MKIIFVTGWSMSWLWKWITSSSIWKLIKSSGKKVWMIKMDPYLQVDAGTMSPYEHWEVFVTEDGAETDLDIGNYERFTDENFTAHSNITSWKVYLSVISKERQWEYLWKTVQIIPHITNEIKDGITAVATNYDLTIVEIWGTVWDIESQAFLEASRQMKKDIGKENIMYVHVAPLLYLKYSWELKTKLIQHSVIKLREYGIQPDILVCRTEKNMNDEIKNKISSFCDVKRENVIEAVDAKSIYQVPELFRKQNLDKIIIESLWLWTKEADISHWNSLVETIINPKHELTIGVIGKYAEFEDTYKSINEAFIHAWVAHDCKINLNWIHSEKLESTEHKGYLKQEREKWKLDGILVPGWFGSRWVEGKISAVRFARENKVPYLWICLWLQVAVIEFARNMCNLTNANSKEFDEKTNHAVIDYMEEQKHITDKWWTMRVWSYEAKLEKWSLAHSLYSKTDITERHRHRYEVNPNYHKSLQENGLVLSGMSPDRKLVEFIELDNHPYFIATQAHPEFKSRLEDPHPLFTWLVKASLQK